MHSICVLFCALHSTAWFGHFHRKQVQATKADAERDGVKVPTTLAEYCIRTRAPPADEGSTLFYDDYYDDELDDDEEEDEDCCYDEDDSGTEDSWWGAPELSASGFPFGFVAFKSSRKVAFFFKRKFFSFWRSEIAHIWMICVEVMDPNELIVRLFK